jgi:type IV pilus assembly protein PilW
MRRNRIQHSRQRGVSIVELLVGVVVGLIVVTGAIKMVGDTLASNRRLLLETRVNQDLRAAADLIVRDIRRAGYWNNAVSGVFSTTGTVATTPNPHRNISLASNVIKYTFARNADNTVDANEWAGYRLQSGVLEFLVARDDANNVDTWQAITDPKVVTITTLTIDPLATPRVVELFTYCACLTKLTCAAADFQTGGAYAGTRPLLTIQQFDIVLAGEAANDPTVRREIRETVRVRNDRMEGTCPNV